MSAGTGTRRLRAGVRPFLVALGAGGMYGSWAAFVHIHGGLGAGVALCAGWTQVGLSVVTTLFFALLLERLFRWPSNPVCGFWLAVSGSSTLGVIWLVVGHTLAGTPHIAEAIAPSVIIGTAFDFAYAGRLLALARRDADIGGAPGMSKTLRRTAVVSTANASQVEAGGLSGNEGEAGFGELLGLTDVA